VIAATAIVHPALFSSAQVPTPPAGSAGFGPYARFLLPHPPTLTGANALRSFVDIFQFSHHLLSVPHLLHQIGQFFAAAASDAKRPGFVALPICWEGVFQMVRHLP